MKKKIIAILSIALIVSMIPMTPAFAAKKVKAKSVSISPKTMTLAVGDIAQMTATKNPNNSTDKLTWSTSDNKVATVSAKGVVQGVSEGTATITVKTTSKKTANCIVTVKEYATDEELRDSIKEDLKAIFATQNDIVNLISKNTYSKKEIDQKISAVSSGNGTVSCDCEKDFKDGDSLALFSGQTLPFTISTEPQDEGKHPAPSKEFTVNSISIKKYHDNQIRGYRFNPYKYVIEIKGIKPDIPDGYLAEIELIYFNKDKSSSETRYYNLRTESENTVEQTYTENGNEFTLKVEQYYMNSSYSSYCVQLFNYYYYSGE